jgi:hypothetical protein
MLRLVRRQFFKLLFWSDIEAHLTTTMDLSPWSNSIKVFDHHGQFWSRTGLVNAFTDQGQEEQATAGWQTLIHAARRHRKTDLHAAAAPRADPDALGPMPTVPSRSDYGTVCRIHRQPRDRSRCINALAKPRHIVAVEVERIVAV